MRTLPTWQQPFLGLDRFPKGLTEFEVEYFFTFSPEELQLIASRRAHLRIGAAVHLGFLKMTGATLEAAERIPLRVMFHLSDLLRAQHIEIATARSLYPRRRTLYQHQRWAMGVLGYDAYTDGRQRTLARALRKRLAEQAPSVDEIVEFAKCWLYQRSILIPGSRRLRAVAVRLRRESERSAQTQLFTHVPQAVIEGWLTQVLRPHSEVPTALEWLQRIPRGRSRTSLDGVLHRIDFLRSLSVDSYPPKHLTLSQQRVYAHRLRRRRPARIRALPVARRSLELACFLHVTLVDTMDFAVTLFDFRATDLRRQAFKRVQARMHRRDEQLREAFLQLERLADDPSIADTQFRESFRVLSPRIVEQFVPRAEWVRRELTQDHRRVRALLSAILSLDLRGTPESRTSQLLAQMVTDSDGNPISQAPVPEPWRPLVEQSPGADRRHALSALTLVTVQRELRNGALWIDNGWAYRARDALFIAPERWRQERSQCYQQLNLPVDFDEYRARIEQSLTRGLADLAHAVENNAVTLDADGIHMRKLVGETEERHVSSTRKALFRAIGDVQFPDMIVSVDRDTRFSWALLGRRPHSTKELLCVYGAVLALGTELNAHGVSMMMPGITEDAIADKMHLLERDHALREANRRVVDFAWRNEIVHHWGRRDHASADAMSLDVSRHLWNARVDPRRRTHSIGIYTHVSEQWGVVYDQPIVLGRRQAGAAIEGALRQTAVARMSRISVDTHGYTSFAMALSSLLGFELCPRLKDLKDRRLHLPRDFVVPPSLSAIVRRDVNVSWTADHWDTLVHLAASVLCGHASAVNVLHRFGDDARGDPLYQAGHRLGQLHRTVFLCAYLTNVAFRREINRALALGESYHTLQRAIHRGGITGLRGRRAEELSAISGALTLLTNIVLAWNTQHMDEVVRRWGGRGEAVDPSTLRHIAPSHLRHINLRGTFDFQNIDDDRILPRETVPIGV